MLAGGRIQRHYAAAMFEALEADLLDTLHREKLTFLNSLLPSAAAE